MNINFFKGFLTGLFTPVAGFWMYCKLVLKTDVDVAYKQLLAGNLLTQVIAISVLANILPLFVYNRRGENDQLKGVVVASVLYAVVISVLYFL